MLLPGILGSHRLNKSKFSVRAINSWRKLPSKICFSRKYYHTFLLQEPSYSKMGRKSLHAIFNTYMIRSSSKACNPTQLFMKYKTHFSSHPNVENCKQHYLLPSQMHLCYSSGLTCCVSFVANLHTHVHIWILEPDVLQVLLVGIHLQSCRRNTHVTSFLSWSQINGTEF